MHNCNCDTAYRTSPIRPNSVNISLSGLSADEEGSCPRNDVCVSYCQCKIMGDQTSETSRVFLTEDDAGCLQFQSLYDRVP